MPSNYRVGITCDDPTVLQVLAGLLQTPECKITEENGEYFWSSSLFETLPEGKEVAMKADQYLPALNGLVKLHLVFAPQIVRSNKVLFTRETRETGAYLEWSARLPIHYVISASEEERERRRQQWVALVNTWAKQADSSDVIGTALTHFGEEVSWNSLYNTYEVIREDYNKAKGITNKRNYELLPEVWTIIDGRNREKDFTESANNAYISGIVSARHSPATSDKAERIEGSSLVEITRSNGKKEQILPMSLHDAERFVTAILTRWIVNKKPSNSQ